MKKLVLLLLVGALSGTAWAQEDDDNVPLDLVPYVNPNYKLLQKGSGSTDMKSRSINALSSGERPDHWDNSLLECWRPTFSQVGGSCGSAAAVCYMFGTETNSYRGLDGSVYENKYPSHFTWLTTYSHSDKRQIMRHVGVPTADVYGGETYSELFGSQDYTDNNYGWMQGYDKWYSAMQNRLLNAYSFPISVETEEGREALKNWLWNHNGDEDFMCGGLANIGVASDMTRAYIASTDVNDSIGVTGMRYVESWGEEYDHSLTIVGYDDRIQFDLDEDGVYGEEDEDEVGAWIIANSWGSSWSNEGFIYCPYKYAGPYLPRADKSQEYFSPVVYFIRKDYRPLRTLKVTMDYTQRSAIALQAGIAADTSATEPEVMVEFEHFRYAGNNDDDADDAIMPMLGEWADGLHEEPMELGYDLTDLSANFDCSEPLKYFFMVVPKSTASGTGHIYDVSLIDYEFYYDGVEIPFDIDTIEIEGTSTVMVSMIVTGENAAKPRNVALSGTTLSWDEPEQSSFEPTGYYVYADGDKLDSVDADVTEFTITAGSQMSYQVSTRYEVGGHIAESAKSGAVALVREEEEDSNVVYTFDGERFTIPGIFKDAYQGCTIEFWIYPTYTTSETDQLIGGFDGFCLEIGSNRTVHFGWDENDGNAYTGDGVKLSASIWSHVAVVIDGPTMTLYVNGIKQQTFTSTTYSGMPAIDELSFGALGASLYSSLDELRIWGRALTGKEVVYNMKMPIAVPTMQPDLLAYYKMDSYESGGITYLRDHARSYDAQIVGTGTAVQGVDESFLTQSRDANASFTIEDGPYYPNMAIEITSDSYVNTTDWAWSAPEAGIEDLHTRNVELVFTEPGKYAVTHSVVALNGTTDEETDSIEVEALPEPTIGFTITIDTLPANEPFSFVNTSEATGYSFTWFMPGAKEETVKSRNANATFTAAGTYDVTLSATAGTDTISLTKQVTAIHAAPEAAFSVYPSTVLKGEPTYLRDESLYDPTEWTWFLRMNSNNYAIEGQNSSFTPVEPGRYSITLTASNSEGSSTLSKSSALVVVNANSETGLYFSGDGETVTFNSPFKTPVTGFTVDFWLNPGSLADAFTLATADGRFAVTTDDAGAVTLTSGDSTVSTDDGFMISDEWHHYAIVCDAGSVLFYRDCEQQQETSEALGSETFSLASSFTIGGSDKETQGMIDEFRIWGTALEQATLAAYANQPIENVDSAEQTDRLLLYYQFNQDEGDVEDLASGGNDGVRSNFGPEGDAWGSSLGVFSLDGSEGSDMIDVTSLYMTNYSQPFLNDSTNINSKYSNFLGLLLGTEESAWVEENITQESDTIITRAYINTSQAHDPIVLRTKGYSFASSLTNHKLYQTVTLPAGYYSFGCSITSTYKTSSSSFSHYLVVAEGTGLPDEDDLTSALASVEVDGAGSFETTFLLTDSTEVSLGLLSNMEGTCYIYISSFEILYEDVEVSEADGLLSLVESVKTGAEPAVKAIPGGVRIVTDGIERVRIVDVAGRVYFDNLVNGVHNISLPDGVYIVGGKKILVK